VGARLPAWPTYLAWPSSRANADNKLLLLECC
jgi:hypothetical protein